MALGQQDALATQVVVMGWAQDDDDEPKRRRRRMEQQNERRWLLFRPAWCRASMKKCPQVSVRYYGLRSKDSSLAS